MGLDISAYRQITNGDPIDIASGKAIDDDYFSLYYIPEFQDRADGLVEGYYRYAEKFDFRAGSYSEYNEWRDSLARLAGWRNANQAFNAKGGAFWELINFADNDGIIGPKTAAKLAKDFADFQAKADTWDEPWWREKYEHWRKACEMAS